MGRLKFLDNVLHHGIAFKTGMVVEASQYGLDMVAQDLIARKLAASTEDSPTHSSTMVNHAQEPIALNGKKEEAVAPNAASDESRRAAARAAQVQADKETQHQVEDTANKEAETRTVQPTPAQVADAAAQVN